MKAAILHEHGKPLTVQEVEVHDLLPNEVRVKVAACGICHSDLSFAKGYADQRLPMLLGHEASGVVTAVGSDVTYLKPGDHVVTSSLPFCGECGDCLTGNPSRCGFAPQRPADAPPALTLDGKPLYVYSHNGGFAEELLVHERALVKIPKEMPLDRAALIGCAVVTGVGAVMNTAKVNFGEHVAVIGCGGVGLNVVQGARLASAGRIIAVDTSDDKLRLARALGATDVVNASQVDPVEAVIEISDGGVHHAFEVIGMSKTLEQAFSMLRAGGSATLIGASKPQERASFDMWQLLYERRVQGSLLGSTRFRVDMPRLAEHYLTGRLDLDTLVSARIRLDDVNDAFAAMERGENARSVIILDEDLCRVP